MCRSHTCFLLSHRKTLLFNRHYRGFSLMIKKMTKEDVKRVLEEQQYGGLSSLVSLDLRDCNLFDGALPDDTSCLSSLRSLNLSRNGFICLPNSISQLSKLKFLCLDNCTKLESLQNFSVSTQLVMAQKCTSLKNYFDQVVVWNFGEARFTLINCLSLANDEECKVGEAFLLDSQVRPLWQRYMEEKIHQSQGFQSILPQTEIPKLVWICFNNSNTSNNSKSASCDNQHPHKQIPTLAYTDN